MSESGTGLPPTAGDLVWPALNFVLFVALLVRFLFRLMPLHRTTGCGGYFG